MFHFDVSFLFIFFIFYFSSVLLSMLYLFFFPLFMFASSDHGVYTYISIRSFGCEKEENIYKPRREFDCEFEWSKRKKIQKIHEFNVYILHLHLYTYLPFTLKFSRMYSILYKKKMFISLKTKIKDEDERSNGNHFFWFHFLMFIFF